METNFFNSSFYYNSYAFNQALKQVSVEKTTFPEMEYLYNNDMFWRNLWKSIDDAKDYVWLQTFIYDDSFSASQTLQKLIEAQKRGAKVCLMIDDINNRADKSLKAELVANGGLVYSLNPIAPAITSFNISRELFRRHHEKVFIADNVAIVGSANITDEYSGPVYGSDDYMDLNIIMRNLCISEVRSFFKEVADHYNHKLDREVSNEEIVKKYNQLYQESIFNIPRLRLLQAHPPHIEQIQDFVLQQINSAQESIRIIQPYYYPIKRFESVLLKALQRGVKVELLTAGKRHTSVYAPLKNSILLNEMLKNGLQVYEIHDKLLHMKMYQFDDKMYTAGSFNNDRWSWDIDNELNIVVENKEEVSRMTNVFQGMKTMAKPIDPDMSIGFTRYCKIKFWDNFLLIAEWCSNKKRAFKTERQVQIHHEVQQAMKQNDYEALEKLRNKRLGLANRIFENQIQNSD